MGQSMARNLMNAGYELVVSTRTAAKAKQLVGEGAQLVDSPREVALHCKVIITMLGYPQDVEMVYLGENGLVQSAQPDSLLIDMTTSSPALAERIASSAKEKHCAALDAPVSGGDVGAREARLSIMVGGEQAAFSRAKPILEKLGKNIVLQGPAGCGQKTKMANQIAVAASTMGTAEALIYAKRAGLDPNSVLQSIESGAAGSWSLSNLGPRMLAENFEPGFYVKHIVKDLGIAIGSAHELGLELPGLETAARLFGKLEKDGGAELGTQAIYKLYLA